MTRQEFDSYLEALTSETGFDLTKEQKAFAYQAAKEYHKQALRIHDVSGQVCIWERKPLCEHHSNYGKECFKCEHFEQTDV